MPNILSFKSSITLQISIWSEPNLAHDFTTVCSQISRKSSKAFVFYKMFFINEECKPYRLPKMERKKMKIVSQTLRAYNSIDNLT